VLKKSVWISFGRKTEEAKGDWRKLCNYKINLSFPLNFITISKSRWMKGTNLWHAWRNGKCIVLFGTLELFGRRT